MIASARALAVRLLGTHTNGTCGTARRGGLETSKWSQPVEVIRPGGMCVCPTGLPVKAHAPVGLLQVSSTRLSPVPPCKREAPVVINQTYPATRNASRQVKTRIGANALRSVVSATALCSTALSGASAQPQARREIVDRVASDINITPDHACTLPQSQIAERLVTTVNANGLMEDVARTVFNEDSTAKPSENGFEAMNRRIQEDTDRRYAESTAISRARETGGQTLVGVPAPAPRPKYRAELYDIKATARIANGLNCSATARVGSLRFAVTYNITLDPSQTDGWTGALNTPTFTVAAALSDTPDIRIHFGDNDLTLAQARLQSERDRASNQAAVDAGKREADAQAAYRSSPAGRIAALRQRQAAARKQQACEANGGTWGFKMGSTIVQVDALTSNDLQLLNEACYFLGR